MFSDNLKQLRKRAGLSQSELAAKFNMPRSTYAMYESGKREPSFETLQQFAAYFHVSLDNLMGTGFRPSEINWFAGVGGIPAPTEEELRAEYLLNQILSALGDLTPEQVEQVLRYARFLSQEQG